MIEAAIFDFDGVIADSLDLVLTVGNRYLRSWGVKPIDRDFYRSNDVDKLYRSYGINPIRELFLLWKIRSEIHKSLRQIPVHPHIVPVVKSLSQKAPLSVLTSNSKDNVLDYLKVHRIHNYFLEIHGNLLLFDKVRGLKGILNREKLDPDKTIYVGDEPRDVRTARNLGVKAAAVDWGFANRELLEKSEPDFIASTAEELLVGIQSI